MHRVLTGSGPGTILTLLTETDAPLAQLVEQRILNPWVRGSSPRGGTTSLRLSERAFAPVCAVLDPFSCALRSPLDRPDSSGSVHPSRSCLAKQMAQTGRPCIPVACTAAGTGYTPAAARSAHAALPAGSGTTPGSADCPSCLQGRRSSSARPTSPRPVRK